MQALAPTHLGSCARLTVRPASATRRVLVTRVTRAALAASADTSKVEVATYAVSAAVSAATAVVGLAQPSAFYNFLQMATPLASMMTPHYLICATEILFAVAASRGLVAAQKGRLASDTYQRITLSVAVKNIACLALMYVYGPALSTLPTPLKAFLSIQFVVGLSQVAIWLSKSARPASVLKDAAGAVGDLLTVPANPLSALYSALTIGAAVAGASYLNVPAAAAIATGQMIKYCGVTLLATAGLLYTLKNGADRNCLGRGTFKQLNEATAVAAAVLGGLLYQGTVASGNSTTALLVAAGVTALTCAYQGFRAVVNKGTGGSVAEDRGNYKYETEDPLENFCANNPDAEECKVFED